MSFDILKEKLISELQVNKLGDLRKFKFINMHLNSTQDTITFFIKVLNYKKWQANKIAYDIIYEQKRYSIKKQLSSYLRQ